MTKSVRTVGFSTVVGLLSAGAWLACSSSAPPPTGMVLDAGSDAAKAGGDSGSDAHADGSGGEGGSSSDGSSSSEDGSGGSDGGSASSGSSSSSGSTDGGSDDGMATGAETGTGDAGEAVTCATYCATVQAACTGGNAQYLSTAACMNACQTFGTGAATTGDTLACHSQHAVLAMTMPQPHCWHAGPYGWGVCGTQCEDFCQLGTSYCSADAGYTAPAPPYADLAACTSACANFTSVAGSATGMADGGFNAAGPTSGNTLDCREYHLGAALQSATAQATHCPHIVTASPVCR